jgi:hypothetical protein
MIEEEYLIKLWHVKKVEASYRSWIASLYNIPYKEFNYWIPFIYDNKQVIIYK